MARARPTVVSLFAGCGGSSLGYRQAGYDERLAVEWDDNAAEVFRANFPGVELYHGDVAKLKDAAALRLARVRRGELDVLDRSPPCQGFSMAGSREVSDPRNGLFREYVRLVRAFRPRALVMENVPGMVAGAMKAVYLEAVAAIRAEGYDVAGRVMDAQFYGVPQARRRVIVVGIRRDLGIRPSFPKPTSAPISVAEAFGYGGVATFTSGFNRGEVVGFNRPAPTLMRGGIAGSSKDQFRVCAGIPDGPLGYMPAPGLEGKALVLAERMEPGRDGRSVTGDGSYYSNRRLASDRPSTTITRSAGLFGRYPSLIHPSQLRGLTIGEVRRLCGFPDDFEFRGKWADAWARLGNSVPPPLMRAIAAHLRENLLHGSPDAERSTRAHGADPRKDDRPRGRARGRGAPARPLA